MFDDRFERRLTNVNREFTGEVPVQSQAKKAKNEMKAALTPQRGKTRFKLKKNKNEMNSKKPLKGTGWEKWWKAEVPLRGSVGNSFAFFMKTTCQYHTLACGHWRI